jgi:hypothetical protein
MFRYMRQYLKEVDRNVRIWFYVPTEACALCCL